MNNFDNIDIIKKKFNWGAFLLTWIWGIFNKSYTPVFYIPILFIPFLGQIIYFFLAIWFGIKGNEWSLKNKSFQDIDDFNNYQKKFIYSALVIFFINFVTLVIFRPIINNNHEFAIHLIPIGIILNIFILACCLIYLIYKHKNLKIFLFTIIFIITVTFSIKPLINLQIYYYEKHNNFKKAISNYEIMLKLPFNDILMTSVYYSKIGENYLKMKDVNSAIINFEKAGRNISYGLENETLSNLYIVNRNYDKAISAGVKYKLCVLNNDWKCVINETTDRIESPSGKTLINNEWIPDDYSAFAYRAIAYKNLGDIQSARKDYDIVLKLLQRTDLKEWFEELYNSNGESYKQSIEKQRKLYNIDN